MGGPSQLFAALAVGISLVSENRTRRIDRLAPGRQRGAGPTATAAASTISSRTDDIRQDVIAGGDLVNEPIGLRSFLHQASYLEGIC